MKSAEEQLDLLINSLNNEQKPPQKINDETSELLAIVRAVKSTRPPAEPSANLGHRIYNSIKKANHRPRILIPAALVACLLVFAVLITWNSKVNVAYAMEKAVANLTNYHGILEIRAKNQAGEEWLVRKVEIWSAGDKYATRQDDGVLTVNNGQRRWQVQPQVREVAVLPLLPDPVRQGFDLRDEAKQAKSYPYTVVGEDKVAGRQATKLQISPPGGQPYFLWVDKESNLPLQLQSAMQNALQTTYTFISFESNIGIDPGIFTYRPPEGYQILDQDPGQQVATIHEATTISKFVPMLPQEPPARIFSFHNRIVLDYGDTTIEQTPAKGSFQPENFGALGKIAGGALEVIGERLRWRQQGIEIKIDGPQRVALARQISADITLPDTENNSLPKAQVKVPVDLDITRADQQQVDGGHSPWQLDPLSVALTFVNLKVSPGGIQGEPKIPESAFKVTINNGREAVIEVKVTDSPVSRVYLQRLIRPDETGIWSVVGYDSR